jgi:hypothetical protein
MWRIVVIALFLLAGCSARQHPAAPVDKAGQADQADQAAQVYGKPPHELRIEPAPSEHPAVSREAARHTIDHPPFAPDGKRTLRYFGLARVTAADGVTTEGGNPPSFDRRLAWVAVFDQSGEGSHSCPPVSGPLRAQPGKPWTYKLVMIVDAKTGLTGLWNEDISGRMLADCGITHR